MRIFTFTLCLILILAACAPQAPSPTAIPAGLRTAVLPTPARTLPTAVSAAGQPLPAVPAAPQASSTSTPAAAPATPLPTRGDPPLPTDTAFLVSPSGSSAATPAAFDLCAPIAAIRLQDLPLLISDSYHPPAMTTSDERHNGIDIAFFNWQGYRQIAGAPVQSVLAGRVAAAEIDSYPYGNVVIIETPVHDLPAPLRKKLDLQPGQSLYLLYAHMAEESLRVTLGQAVTACQTLGRVGHTGNSGQAHLHLETRRGPAAVQFTGLTYYTEDATREEEENYRRWATGGEFLHFDPLFLLLHEFGYVPTATPRRPWNW